MVRQLAIGLVLVTALAYLAVLTASLVDRQSRSRVDIRSYPDDVSISINGSPGSNQSVYYLEPGKYTATVSREGFSTESIRIDSTEDNRYPALVSLTAQSDEALAWEDNNISVRQEYESLSSSILSELGEDLRRQQPIIRHLPARTSLYSIGYISNEDESITVTIHAPDVYIQYALNHIKRWDIDPVDYDIEFVNQRNVFRDE